MWPAFMYKLEKLLSISFCDQCDFCSAQLSPWKPGRGQPTERRERMLGIKKRGKIRLRKSKREMVVATAFFFVFVFFLFLLMQQPTSAAAKAFGQRSEETCCEDESVANSTYGALNEAHSESKTNRFDLVCGWCCCALYWLQCI